MSSFKNQQQDIGKAEAVYDLYDTILEEAKSSGEYALDVAHYALRSECPVQTLHDIALSRRPDVEESFAQMARLAARDLLLELGIEVGSE